MRTGELPTNPVAQGSEAAREVSWTERLRDGTQILIRPIHIRDVAMEKRFIEALSPQSRRFRFLESMQSPSDALLKQMTAINHATDAAYVAVIGLGKEEQEIGVARFSASSDATDCEFAVTVSDEWQRKGLATLLMKHLIEVAQARGIRSLHSSDVSDNGSMRKFEEHLHFRQGRDPDDATQVLYSIDLGTAPDANR
jgi:GNAT superfamily N-acetyltransferase